MSKKEPDSLFCRFCGAPYRQIVQANTVQLKCDYCGGTFVIPQDLSDQVRCQNHPDKLPVGLCNDCGGSFCGDCLHIYDLRTERGPPANLFLCPGCLFARHRAKADQVFMGGLAMLFIGILVSFMFLPLLHSAWSGLWLLLLFAIVGLTFSSYGVAKRRTVKIDEPTVNSVRRVDDRIRASPATPETYNRLLSVYLSRYGPTIGYDLLRNEISERMSRGQTFWEAVWFLDQAEKTAQ